VQGDGALIHLAALTITGILAGCSAADQGPVTGALAPSIDASASSVDASRTIATPYANGTADLCPVGLPPPVDGGCPGALPQASTCCSPEGLVCTYPAQNVPDYAASHPYAQCTAITTPTGDVPVWETGIAVDRNLCQPPSADAGFSALEDDAGTECAARPIVACDPASPQTAQELLNAQVQQLVDSCGFLECAKGVQVDFQDGCAVDMGFSPYSYPSPSFSACVGAGLAASRFACADGLSCAFGHGPPCPIPVGPE
jgi:hypothetical protein